MSSVSTTNISETDNDFDRTSGTGLSASLPRHFVPGYYQPVPPGQKPLTHRAPRIKLATCRSASLTRGALPAKWLGPITSTVDTNDSPLTRNKGLRAGAFLERFLGRSEFFELRKSFLRDWIVFLVEVSKPASRDRCETGRGLAPC